MTSYNEEVQLMQQTLFAILTSEQARDEEEVAASLDREFSAGAPWFSKASTQPLDT
jgi:hypothetical protein